jgi:hypothetical protein
MFRPSAGFKASYQDMTLIVAPDFDEWRVFVQGPQVVIHGGRQFTESKAKDCAQTIADSYLREERHEDVIAGREVQWAPMEPKAWLNWRP